MTTDSYLRIIPRVLVAGGLFAAIFFVVFSGIIFLINSANPELLNSILALIVAMPIYIATFIISLISASLICYLTLPKKLGRSRYFIVPVGASLVLSTYLVLHFALPGFDLLPLAALTTSSSILWFGVVALSARLGRLNFIIVPVLASIITSLLIWQFEDGTKRAQLSGLKNMSYTIYIPKDGEVKSVVPINGEYDGYDEGVSVSLDIRAEPTGQLRPATMYEYKAPEDQSASSCGKGYLPDVGYLNTTPTCKLVGEKNGIRVYMREYMFYAAYYKQYKGTREQFTVAGNTLIEGGGIGESSCDFTADKVTKKISIAHDCVKDMSKRKAFWLNLVPVARERLEDVTVGREQEY